MKSDEKGDWLSRLKFLKAAIKIRLEFEFTDWEEIKRFTEEAQFIEDNEGYGYMPEEKTE